MLIVRRCHSHIGVISAFARSAFSHVHGRGCHALNGIAHSCLQISDIIPCNDLGVSHFLCVCLDSYCVCLFVCSVYHITFQTISNGNDGHHGRNADDDSQHGQEGTTFVRADIIQRHFDIFKKLSHLSFLPAGYSAAASFATAFMPGLISALKSLMTMSPTSSPSLISVSVEEEIPRVTGFSFTIPFSIT